MTEQQQKLYDKLLKKVKTLESMYGNLEKTLVKVNTEKENYKKASEIMRTVLHYSYITRSIIKQTYDEGWITKKEYELLKEIYDESTN